MSTPNCELLCFANPEALAQAVAQKWCDQIVLGNRPFTVALSGGRIATHLFRSIAKAVQGRAAIDSVHFLWADERCIPPDHPESNYRTARELLFEPLQIPSSHIHRIRGEDDPVAAAQSATDELLRIAPKSSNGIPVLDLIFLGMGEDGHVASLFPGVPPKPGVYLPVVGPKPPPRRITLSYDVIAAARQVWVLASGQGKEAALQESLDPAGRTPLAWLLQRRENTEIFADFALPKAASCAR